MSPSLKIMSMMLEMMPKRVLTAARFVYILREPGDRLLSWYNHNLWDHMQNNEIHVPCMKDAYDNGRNISFAEFVGGSPRQGSDPTHAPTQHE